MTVCQNSKTVVLRGLPRGRGFTLAELVVSMVVMSILMVGLGSAILIASHALPDDQSPAESVVVGAEVADRIVEELRSAIWIRERNATSVEFAVPDRDSDGNAERIRYAWSGTAGDPLTRQYNGGTVVDVLEDVNEFDLAYDLKAVAEEYPGPPVEGAEEELASRSTAYNVEIFYVKKDEWPGQYFKPSLSADAVSWRVTKVYVYARSEATDEETAVQLRLPDGNRLPTETILDEVILPESDLEDWYEWHPILFSNGPDLSPGTALCLVLKNASGGGVSARIWYDGGGGSGAVHTKDAGSSWTYFSNVERLYYIYGKVSTPGPPQTATRHYVAGVQIALQAGADSIGRVVTTAQTLNAPELLSGLWEAHFDGDPTLDRNGDGNDDWLVHTGGAFDLGSISGGVWYADEQLDSYPNNNFTGLTTIEVRCRATGTLGTGPKVWIGCDWSGSTYGPMFVLLQAEANGTQTLTLYHQLDVATPLVLVQVPGLSAGFVTLRLLIDPEQDTVNLKVNRRDCGTYIYNTFTPPNDNRFVSIGPIGSGAEFDSVSVRVAE